MSEVVKLPVCNRMVMGSTLEVSNNNRRRDSLKNGDALWAMVGVGVRLNKSMIAILDVLCFPLLFFLAKDNALVVVVCVLYAYAEVRNGSRT